MKEKLVWIALLLGSILLAINAWGNRTISFTADLTGNLDIYIMDINRKNPVNLTNHPADDTSPTWAPDGSAFTYVSHKDGNPEIYVMEMKNKESRRLTNNQATDIDPAWSPDGRWIAFASNQHREHAADTDIYIMDPSFITNSGQDAPPTMGPDSSAERDGFRSADELLTLDCRFRRSDTTDDREWHHRLCASGTPRSDSAACSRSTRWRTDGVPDVVGIVGNVSTDFLSNTGRPP